MEMTASEFKKKVIEAIDKIDPFNCPWVDCLMHTKGVVMNLPTNKKSAKSPKRGDKG